MAWTIELSEASKKTLRKLDRQSARRITEFLLGRVAEADNPRSIGKALHGSLNRYWSYRVGDYRLLCELKDEVLKVLVLKIGHRSDIYR